MIAHRFAARISGLILRAAAGIALCAAVSVAVPALAGSSASPQPTAQDHEAAYCSSMLSERMADMVKVTQSYGASDVINHMMAVDYARRLRFAKYLEGRGYFGTSPVLASSKAKGRQDMQSYVNLAGACRAACQRGPSAAKGGVDPASASDTCSAACAAKAAASPVAARLKVCNAAAEALPMPEAGATPPTNELIRPENP